MLGVVVCPAGGVLADGARVPSEPIGIDGWRYGVVTRAHDNNEVVAVS
jgi:hypothetical protein